MKMRNFMIAMGLLAFAGMANAQDIPEQCQVNLSLMNESAKNKQYADAYGPWKAVFDECPGASKAIYQRGRTILQWKLVDDAKKGDGAAYKATFELLMKMYDSRIEHFGDDPNYPTPWILGLKGIDYATYAQWDKLKKPAYEYLEQSVNGMGEKCELEVLRQFVMVSSNIYKAEPEAHGAKFIADFMKANDLLDKQANDPNNDQAELAGQIKLSLEQVFAQSGAADCETLDGLYAEKVKANLTNLEYLNTVMTLYRMVGCTEQNVYFEAAAAAHAIQPTAESAAGVAEMAYKKGEYEQAVSYYEQATEMYENAADKAECQFKIAQVYYKDLKNNPRAKQYVRKSLDLNPDSGKAYFLLGMIYASAKNIYPDDAVLSKTAYWAAVDQFIKAKQIDPSLAEGANEMIATYSKYFPTKEEIFFHKDLNGKTSFTVGSWIGETTAVREAKQ